jgi:hypothetical protein
MQNARLPVNVGAVEAEQLLRSQAGSDTDDRDRPVARPCRWIARCSSTHWASKS